MEINYLIQSQWILAFGLSFENNFDGQNIDKKVEN